MKNLLLLLDPQNSLLCIYFCYYWLIYVILKFSNFLNYLRDLIMSFVITVYMGVLIMSFVITDYKQVLIVSFVNGRH
jgi:hypothetical protein